MSISKRRREKRHKSFVMLPRKTLRGEEWRELSPRAKILYIHLKGKYNGQNNGHIQLHYSELYGIKGLSSPSTISKAFTELEQKEWIRRTKYGGLYRYACEYELTGKFDDSIK
jgi:hypothetical protein